MSRSVSLPSRGGRWLARALAVVATVSAMSTAGAAIDAADASAATTHAAVHAAKPTVKLKTPTTAVVGALVTAHLKGSKAPAHVRGVVIDFGDHTTPVHRTALVAVTSHRYAKPGHYTITVRITDRAKRTAKASRKITVRAAKAAKRPTKVVAGGAAPPTDLVAPTAPVPGATALPVSMDLTADAMAVGDQSTTIGSCVTWAIDYAMLGWYANEQGIASGSFAPMYAYSQVNLGSALAGSKPADVFALAASQGEDTAAHYGAGAWYAWNVKPTAADIANAANYRITGHNTLFAAASGGGSTGAADIEQALAAGHPVAMSLIVHKSFESFTGQGTYDDTSATVTGSHEVLALGYDANGVLIQNSWGTGWADQGFARVSWAVIQNDVYEADTIDGLVTTRSTADGTAPSTTAPTQSMSPGTSLVQGSVPVTIQWSGSDNSGSVAGYQLMASTNGAAWAVQTLSAQTATSITYDLAAGSRYAFSVRSWDAAGNVSAWATGAAFTVADHAETDAGITWSSGWQYAAWTAADAGQLATATANGAWATFSFTGSNVAWVTARGSNRGQAYFFIDGSYVGSADLYSATPVAQSIGGVMNVATSGAHTVSVEVVGTSGRPAVDIDSFIVLG